MTTIDTLKNSAAARQVSRLGLHIKKHSPEILMGVGVAGIVTSTVMACRATLKVEDVLDDLERRKRDLADVNDASERNPEFERAHKATNAAIHIKAGLDLAKLYGPSVTVGLASLACIMSSHGIMKKRNAALGVAYNALEKSFSDYRKRVEEHIGEEAADQLRYEETTETQVDENGEEKEVKVVKAPGLSIYARCFDETNRYWQKSPLDNQAFLRAQQNFANDRLRSRGHLFLNDVYEMLGFEDTPHGAVTGWIFNGDGDNYVDFGIFDMDHEMKRAFHDGDEPAIWLDFNVQGSIYNLI